MTTLTIPQSVGDILAHIAPGRGSWPSGDMPGRLPRRARPTLATLRETHPDMGAALVVVRRWAAAFNAYLRSLNDADNESMAGPPSLILSGPNGTGKTHIARAIQWSLVLAVLDDDGRAIDDLAAPACRWYAAADLLGSLGETRDNDGFFYSGRPSQLVGNAPFVVLDDVAAELSIPFVAYPAQEAERQIRYHLFFDWCVANRVPVVLTTNLSAAGPESDLARHVGPRAWSRLMQMSPRGFIVSLWNVPDYRMIAGGRA